MRPRRDAAEYRGLEAFEALDLDASMRPRRDAAEYLNTRSCTGRLRVSFNEAAA